MTSHHNKPPGLRERRQFCSPPPHDDGSPAHPFRPKTRLYRHALALSGAATPENPAPQLSWHVRAYKRTATKTPIFLPWSW